MITAPEQVTRQILGNVPEWLSQTFYGLVLLSIASAALVVVARIRRRRLGRPNPVANAPASSRLARLRAALAYCTFQSQLLRDPVAGIAHLLTFYGFVILFIGTCLVFLEHDTPLHFFYGGFYRAASSVVDLGGLAFLVGLAIFLWRRHVFHTTRLLPAWWVALFGWLLFTIGASGFLLEATRIAIDFPPFEVSSVVGYPIAKGLAAAGISGPVAATFHPWMWGAHAALCVVFFFTGPLEVFWTHALRPRELDRKTVAPAVGAGDVSADSRGSSGGNDLVRFDSTRPVTR